MKASSGIALMKDLGESLAHCSYSVIFIKLILGENAFFLVLFLSSCLIILL